MQVSRFIVIAATYAAATISGLSKQLEAPRLVDQFEQGGIGPEVLSLLGAAEFVLALALLFPRMRPVAGTVLACIFGASAYMLWPHGITPLVVFNAAMVPLSLLAAFWRGRFYTRPEPYLGAVPLGVSKPRR